MRDLATVNAIHSGLPDPKFIPGTFRIPIISEEEQRRVDKNWELNEVCYLDFSSGRSLKKSVHRKAKATELPAGSHFLKGIWIINFLIT
jgi:hypothetical protein